VERTFCLSHQRMVGLFEALFSRRGRRRRDRGEGGRGGGGDSSCSLDTPTPKRRRDDDEEEDDDYSSLSGDTLRGGGGGSFRKIYVCKRSRVASCKYCTVTLRINSRYLLRTDGCIKYVESGGGEQGISLCLDSP
jgi:hypothetical protein